MKKRNMICLAGLMIISLVPVGCGKDKEQSYEAETDIQAVAEDAEYGEVVSVSDNVITIKEGPLKDRGDMTDEGEGEDTSSGDKMTSMLNLTGEEKDIEINESTVIKRQNRGRMNGGNRPEGTPPADMQKGEGSDNRPEGTPPADMQKGEHTDNRPEGTPSSDMRQGNMEDEEISISDINEGDVVSVIYNDDGSVSEISVISVTR